MHWRFLCTGLAVALLLGWSASETEKGGWPPLGGGVLQARAAASADLEIEAGARRFQVRGRTEEGVHYLRLEDLSQALGLQLTERGEQQVSVQGPAGRLDLTHGRRLVRIADLNILVSAAPWQRRRNEWYVSRDFIDKALPQILTARLDRVDQYRYRTEALPRTRVDVRVINHRDHVTLVFLPASEARFTVREFRDHIFVRVDGHHVDPVLPSTSPDSRIVEAIEPDRSNAATGFRIRKGSRFHSYREITLSDPRRQVLDLYAPPETEPPARTAAADPPPVETPTATPRAEASDSPPLHPADPRRRPSANVVTIDPGHGGNNDGVRPVQDHLEKNYSLTVASRVQSILQESGFEGMLTRSRDLDLPLAQRSALANLYRSQAFVSIHTGGAPSPEARGAVVYVHRPVHRPNPVAETVDAGDMPFPDDASSWIRWEEAQNRHMARSRMLATQIQRELNRLYGVENRVVEAPLTLLESVAAPAVLVEVGFLTNPEDQELLASPEFRERLARAIAGAVERFVGPRTPVAPRTPES